MNLETKHKPLSKLATALVAAAVLVATAPRAAADAVYFEDFEAGDGGYSVTGTTTSWAHGAPAAAPGPGGANSGANAWATNLAGDYGDNEDGSLNSPAINLTTFPADAYILSWQQHLDTEMNFDFATVEVSKDGGANWRRVYGKASGTPAPGWTEIEVLLDSSYQVSNLLVRWIFTSDPSQTAAGWYIDDVEIRRLNALPFCYDENFDADDGGYTVSGTNPSWDHGAPLNGPGGAMSSPNGWATNLSGNYNTSEDSTLTSPDIDLSAQAGLRLLLSWEQFLITEEDFDVVSVDVSKDGGMNWNTVYGPVSGDVNNTWVNQLVLLDPSHAVNNFKVRFNMVSEIFFEREGVYIDDVQVCAVGEAADVFPDSYTVNEGETLIVNDATGTAGGPENDGLLVNDSDPNGLALVALIDTPTLHGNLTPLSSQGTFIYNHNGSETTSDSFTYRARNTDGVNSRLVTASITVVPVNDAPSFTATPAVPLATPVNTAIPFTGPNALSVADPDLGSGAIRITFSAQHGSFSVTLPGGSTIDTEPLVFTAPSLAAMNTSLATASYLPDPSYGGTDTIEVTINDFGNTGLDPDPGNGGPTSEEAAIHIAVTVGDDCDAWQWENFGAALNLPGLESTIWGELADGDHDFFTNVQEFLFNLDPTASQPVEVPTVDPLPGQGLQSSVSITYPIRRDRAGVNYTTQWTTDLVNWFDTDIVEVLVDGTDPVVDIMRATATPPGGPHPQIYLRIRTIRGPVTVYTIPVGYHTLAIDANTFSLTGTNFAKAPRIAGALDAVGPNTLTDLEADFDSAFAGVPTFDRDFGGPDPATPNLTLEITSGPNAGVATEVVSFSGTVLTTLDDLTGIASPTETFIVRETATITDIFGPANASGLNAGGGGNTTDKIWAPRGLAYDKVYYNDVAIPFPPLSVGWKVQGRGDTDAANLPLYHTNGFIVERVSASNVDVVVTGQVRVDEAIVAIRSGFNPVDSLFPLGQTLSNSGLDALTKGGPGTADIIWVPSTTGSGWDKYYYQFPGIPFPPNPEGWKLLGGGNTDRGNVPLQRGIIIERRTGDTNLLITPASLYDSL